MQHANKKRKHDDAQGNENANENEKVSYIEPFFFLVMFFGYANSHFICYRSMMMPRARRKPQIMLMLAKGMRRPPIMMPKERIMPNKRMMPKGRKLCYTLESTSKTRKSKSFIHATKRW
jgi:hypothetical protein